MHICLYISPLDIYLFISIFAQLEKGCVTSTFSFPISHFPFAICISVTVAAAAAAVAEFPFSLLWVEKSNAKQTFHCLLEEHEEKMPKFFLHCSSSSTTESARMCACVARGMF